MGEFFVVVYFYPNFIRVLTLCGTQSFFQARFTGAQKYQLHGTFQQRREQIQYQIQPFLFDQATDVSEQGCFRVYR